MVDYNVSSPSLSLSIYVRRQMPKPMVEKKVVVQQCDPCPECVQQCKAGQRKAIINLGEYDQHHSHHPLNRTLPLSKRTNGNCCCCCCVVSTVSHHSMGSHVRFVLLFFFGLPTECYLNQIGKPVLYAEFESSTRGCWMRDPKPLKPEDEDKYWLTRTDDNQLLFEYNNKDLFRQNKGLFLLLLLPPP